MKNTNEHLGKMIKIALLGAIAAVLMCLEIPFPTTTWLKIDFGEPPALIGGLAFGPLAAIVIQTLKIALKLLIMGTHTGFVGEIANYIIGLFFVIPASLIYKYKRLPMGALIGMIVGTVVMEVGAIATNYYFLLPAFHMNLSGSEFMDYVLVGLLPVNTIKAVIVSVVAYFVYKKLANVIFKVEK